MENVVFSKKKDTQLTGLGFTVGTICNCYYESGGIEESEDGRRSSAWSEDGSFKYVGAQTDTIAIVRIGKNVHAFNIWDPSLDLGVTDLETAIEERELLESDETTTAAEWFGTLFEQWPYQIQLTDTIKVTPPALSEEGMGVSCDPKALLSMYVNVYDDHGDFGAPREMLALDVYREFNGKVDPTEINANTRAADEAEKAARKATEEEEAAWFDSVKAATEKIVALFDEKRGDGELTVTYWNSGLECFETRTYKWLEVKVSKHMFSSKKEVTIEDDWRRTLTDDEINGIVAACYDVEVVPSAMTLQNNRHFVDTGWEVNDSHQVVNNEFDADKKVGYGDTFDWTKPARLRKTRKGNDFLVNDENGAYFRFFRFEDGIDTTIDGEIVWQAENCYGDIYMIVATTPSQDPDEKDFDNTPFDNTGGSATPEVSSNDGEVFSNVDVMKGSDDMVLRFEPDANLGLGASDGFTIGADNTPIETETAITFINTSDSSTTNPVDNTDQEAEQHLKFLAGETLFTLTTAFRYYTHEEIGEWYAEIVDNKVTDMIVAEVKERRDAWLTEEGNKNVRSLAGFVSAFLDNPQEWTRNFLIQQVTVRAGKDHSVVTELKKCVDEYIAYMSAMMNNVTPLALPAQSVTTAAVTAMNKVVTTPAIIELGPVVSYGYTQMLPVPTTSTYTAQTAPTAHTFSLTNITGEGSGFVINLESLAGEEDSTSSITYQAAVEQPGGFAEGEVVSSQFTVVKATVPFDIQRFNKEEKGMKKKKTEELQTLFAKLDEVRKQAESLKMSEVQLASIVSGDFAGVQTQIELEAAKFLTEENGVELYSHYVAAAMLAVNKKIVAYFAAKEEAAVEAARKEGKIVVKTVDESTDLAHVIAEREGTGINMLGINLKDRNHDHVTFAMRGSLTYNRVSRAVELGVGGLQMGSKTLSGILPTDEVITKYTPNFAMIRMLGNDSAPAKLFNSLWSAKKKEKAEILIVDKDNAPYLFMQDVHGDNASYVPFIHAGREQRIREVLEEYQEIDAARRDQEEKAAKYADKSYAKDYREKATGLAEELKMLAAQLHPQMPKAVTNFVSQAGKQRLLTGKRFWHWYCDNLPRSEEEFNEFVELAPETANAVKEAMKNGKFGKRLASAARSAIKEAMCYKGEDDKWRWLQYDAVLSWILKRPGLNAALKESIQAQIKSLQDGINWFRRNAPAVHAEWLKYGIPTTRDEIIKWGTENGEDGKVVNVYRVRHEDWLASPGMLKKHEVLVSVDRVDQNGNTLEEVDWDAVYRYVTGGIVGHLAKFRKGFQTAKVFAQDGARPGHTFAPARLYENTVPVVALTPFKFGETSDGQYLLDAVFVQTAFNASLVNYFFTLNAVIGLSLQGHAGLMSIKGVGNVVYPFMMKLRLQDHIRLANAAEHDPKMGPDDDGNYVVRLVMGEMSAEEEAELFKWRNGDKKALWRNCLVFIYPSAESKANKADPGVFADFNSFKCSCAGKDVKDSKGNTHKCMTGLHVMACSDKKDKANISAQALAGDLAAAPAAVHRETIKRFHESLEKKLDAALNLQPAMVSAADLETRRIMDTEGDFVEIVPSYNDLTSATSPLFGRQVYQADGRADLQKTANGIGTKIHDFKIPTPARTYFLACDPAHLIGGSKGVLKTTKKHAEVFATERLWKTVRRLYRFPKARFNDSLWVKLISPMKYAALVVAANDMDFAHKFVTIVYAASMSPGVLCLPNVADIFTTIGGADTDGDHGRVTDECEEIRKSVEHGHVVEKPKDDLEDYLAAYETFVNAVETGITTVEDPFIAKLKAKLAAAKADPVAVQKYSTAKETAKKAAEKFEQAKAYGFVNERKFSDGIKRAWNDCLKTCAAVTELLETASSETLKDSAEMQELIKAWRRYEIATMPKTERLKTEYETAKEVYDAAKQANAMTDAIKQTYSDAKDAYDKSTAYETTLAEYKAAGKALDCTKIGKLEKAVRTLENLFKDWKVTCARIAALEQTKENAAVEVAKKKSLEEALFAAMRDVE